LIARRSRSPEAGQDEGGPPSGLGAFRPLARFDLRRRRRQPDGLVLLQLAALAGQDAGAFVELALLDGGALV
jgi:hypothetical protein